MENLENDKFLNTLKDIIKQLVIGLVLVIIITQFIVRPVHVEGISMEATLSNGAFGFSDVISTKLGTPKRFEIIVVRLHDENRQIVKRVIGLPGETVEYKNDILYIDGKAMTETYLDTDFVKRRSQAGEFTKNFGPIVVPEDSYFLLGDNRPRSSDSRQYGSFHKSLIKSKSVFVLYPFNKIGLKR